MGSDERKEIMDETWKQKRGLHFWCEAEPISKQCKNKLRKEASRKVMEERVSELKQFKKDLTIYYPEGDLELELIFGIKKKRYGYKRNDTDNLVKHAVDCLKGVLFNDDSQLKRIIGTKYLLNNDVPDCTGVIISKFKKDSTESGKINSWENKSSN